MNDFKQIKPEWLLSSNVCSKCGAVTNDSDDLHCRKIFVDEINKLMASNETERASFLFISASFDEEWKKHLLNKFGEKLMRSVEAEMKQMDNERLRKIAEKLHQERLIALGINYLGISPVFTVKKHRITHCYNCQESLDNSIHIECNKCHWIICKCGACGCGFNFLDKNKCLV